MLSSGVLAETLIRTLAPPPDSSYVRPSSAASTVTPLESADPKNVPVTLLQSADPKTKHLKSFRIRRSEKRGGEGGKLLTRNMPAAGTMPAHQSLVTSHESPSL